MAASPRSRSGGSQPCASPPSRAASSCADQGLPDKDRPIFEAALGSGCSVLLTGDTTHFGHLFGREIEGLQVLTASILLAQFSA